jgi:GTPase SAR1 family protein
MVPLYAKDARVAVLTFSSVTERESLESIPDWHSLVTAKDVIPRLFVVGNKIDAHRVVSLGAGRKCADALDGLF